MDHETEPQEVGLLARVKVAILEKAWAWAWYYKVHDRFRERAWGVELKCQATASNEGSERGRVALLMAQT
jgi:hypothetical protein